MSKVFKSVKPIFTKKNAFNLSNESLLTTEFGRLTPILMQECVPGDIFKINTTMLIRMAPLYAPTMSRVNAYVHYFFFPDRLGDEEFETFITGGEDGNGTITTRRGTSHQAELKYFKPFELFELYNEVITGDISDFMKKFFLKSSLYDYLGFPSPDWDSGFDQDTFTSYDNTRIPLRPFVAYQSVYNEYYRSEDFRETIDIVKDCVGGNVITYLKATVGNTRAYYIMEDLLTLKQRNWEKDYFTSALPWPQRGEETTIGENTSTIIGEGTFTARDQGSGVEINVPQFATHLSIGGRIVASVNEFRRAMSIQRFKEASARFGARYFEYIRGFFNTKVSDARLQRPEFIGGSKVPVTFGEVLQTSQTTAQSPQGSYAGRGIAGGVLPVQRYKCKEYGWIVGILSIMPKPFYMQGMPRKYQRWSKLDFYNPLFANIGEQEIKQGELIHTYVGIDGASIDIAEQANTQNNRLFGYTPRYSEMRYNPSEVHGDFRTNLQSWHTARIMYPDNLNSPNSLLSAQFLVVDPQSPNRIFNYQRSDYDHFWIELYNDIRAIRPLPKYGTPLF